MVKCVAIITSWQCTFHQSAIKAPPENPANGSNAGLMESTQSVYWQLNSLIDWYLDRPNFAFDPPFDSLPLQYSGCQENVLQKSILKDPLHTLSTLYLLSLCFLAKSPFWIQSSVYLNRILFLFPKLSHNFLLDTEVDDNEITWLKL